MWIVSALMQIFQANVGGAIIGVLLNGYYLYVFHTFYKQLDNQSALMGQAMGG